METIQFGSRKIDFQLEFSRRKSLGITVMPELTVVVKAPTGANLDKVREKVRKKAPWIIRQQSFFLLFHPRTPARKFVSGETHLYLGRQYRLRILKSKAESVKLRGRFMEVRAANKASVRELVNEWYQQVAMLRLTEIAKPLIHKFKKHNVEPTSLVLRKMPTRWGSCTPKGKVILNPELIKAPKGCIEYVITHELCHLVHRDHTKYFIALQTKEMRDWEKWKIKLEKLLA
jgi:predicted metal-dependent hydrolase